MRAIRQSRIAVCTRSVSITTLPVLLGAHGDPVAVEIGAVECERLADTATDGWEERHNRPVALVRVPPRQRVEPGRSAHPNGTAGQLTAKQPISVNAPKS